MSRYPIGHTLTAPHPQTAAWTPCTVTGYHLLGGVTVTVCVRFADGVTLDIPAAYLAQDGSGF